MTLEELWRTTGALVKTTAGDEAPLGMDGRASRNRRWTALWRVECEVVKCPERDEIRIKEMAKQFFLYPVVCSFVRAETLDE